MPRSHRLSLVVLVILALAGSAAVSFRWCYEPDLWWHLAQGREIAAGHLLRTNLFSFTHPDFPQPSTSWLFDLGTYGLWQAGGAVAVQLAQALALFATLALLFAACRERASVAVSGAVVAFGFFVLEPRALPRPHTLSFAGMAACALLIERARTRGSVGPLVWAVPLLAVWSNLHVESLFGLAYLGCFAAGMVLESDRAARALGWRALLVVAACAATTTINPYGLGLVQYLLDNARVPDVIRIAELQPPYLPNYAPFYVYLFATLGLLLAAPVPRAWEVVATGIFTVLSLRYLRFTPLLVCATASIVASRLVAVVGRAPLLPLGAVFLGLLTMRLDPATFARQLGVGTESLAPAEIIPRGATAFAARVGLRGPLFDSNNIGGWVIWDGYPEMRVFQDSRLQAYPAQHFRDIMDASRSQARWNALVAGVDWAMLSVPRANELSGARRFPPREWATVYWDDAAEILVRRHGAFASLIDAYEYRVLRPDFDPFAPLPTDLSRVDRLLVEVQRNREDNPRGFAAAAWLCAHGDDEPSCAAALAMADARPELRRAAVRLERRHAAQTDTDDESP